MSLHVNQEILGAVQQGQCSELNDENPYSQEDKKKFAGWKEGHSEVVARQAKLQKYLKFSGWRHFLCAIGFHKYYPKLVPGRPKVRGCKIVGRDPLIKKFVCSCCSDVYFIGLAGK